MTIDEVWRAYAAPMADALGPESVELRRSTTLRDASDAAALHLVAAAAAAEGATLLHLAAADGRPLRGAVPAAAAVLFPGGSTTVADDFAAAAQVASVALPVAALPVAVEVGAAVSVAPYASRTVDHCIVHGRRELAWRVDLSPEVTFALSIPKSLLADAPRQGDVAITGQGTGVLLGDVGDGGGSWEVDAGRGATRGGAR